MSNIKFTNNDPFEVKEIVISPYNIFIFCLNLPFIILYSILSLFFCLPLYLNTHSNYFWKIGFFFFKKGSSIDMKVNDFNKKYDANIIVANHCSPLDEVILSNLFSDYTYLSSIFAKKIPLLNKVIDIKPLIIYDPKKKGVTQSKINQFINNNGKIIIYPEGCMTNGKSIITFRKGAFVPGKNIIPVLIEYKDHYPAYCRGRNTAYQFLFGIFGRLYNKVEVTILPTYVPSKEEKQDPILFANNVRNYMASNSNLPLSDYSVKDSFAYQIDTK